MKNYYEILEISKNASQEIVEKAYKVLVKKYHPDLQTTSEGKAKSESKIKEINEAYDVISDKQKRKEYDKQLLIKENQQRSEANKSYTQGQYYSQMHYRQENQQQYNYQSAQQPKRSQTYQQQKTPNPNYQQTQQNAKEQEQFQKKYQDAINRAYHDAYIKDLKNRGYRIKYKKTLNDYLRSMIALLITIGIIALIIQIPVVSQFLNDLYKENILIKGLVDAISSFFK